MTRLLDLVGRLLGRPHRPPLAHVERLGVHIAAASATAIRRAPLPFIKCN